MDQSSAPILEGLAEHRRLDRYGFTPPAHRQGRGADAEVLELLGLDAFRSDLVATAGLEDRRAEAGRLQSAQELMADAVGAEQAIFSTCGSSLAIKAAMLAVAGDGAADEGEILIGRDSHKSVISGLALAGFQPVWIRPTWDEQQHLAHPPSVSSVEKLWDEHPDAAAALIVSPTPYGTCADLAGMVEICHSRGKPLIVDEAWGAHLPFHDDLPTWAMDAGADVCVVSVHKMGMGLEQGSVLHLQGDLVDPARLTLCTDLLSTTSANVLLYAAIDGWRRQMVRDGRRMLGATLDLARETRAAIEAIDGLHVIEEELRAVEASHDLDPLHVLIDLSDLGVSGFQAADWLRETQRIDISTHDQRRIEVVISQADDASTTARLLGALTELVDAASGFEPSPPVKLPTPQELELETAMRPRDAFFARAEAVPAAEAAGRIAVEQLTPYPPGAPAVAPGERLTEPVIEYLRSGLAAGMAIPDASDPSLETFRVVREG